MPRRTRRQFLEDSMFATAAAAAMAWQAQGGQQVLADEPGPTGDANDKLSICCVGVRGRGQDHIHNYVNRKGYEITWVVDADEGVARNCADAIGKKQGRTPQVAVDLRKAYDDSSVDIVSIATPNHWHALAAIWALQAGKDVYVEKPVSHNVSEGRRIVEAARKYNRICQTGTQCRSSQGMREGMQFLHDGGIGEIKLARGLCYKRRPSIGPKGDYTPPDGLNYDLWLGPAPMVPVTRRQFHYDWHWQWDYGNGDLGNQGIHQMDLARWALNVNQLCDRTWSFGGRIGYEDAGETPNTQVCCFQFEGAAPLVFEVRGLETKPFMGTSVGNIIHGTEGYAIIPSYQQVIIFDLDGKKVREFNGGGNHYVNFLNAVRSRRQEDLTADILEGHLSSALCHLGNISYRQPTEDMPLANLRQLANDANADVLANDLLGRLETHVTDNQLDLQATHFKVGTSLAFDPQQEKFIDNTAADALLTREYRAPFVVPTSDKV